jgi:RNA polymerase sigma-70 factor (ECF subfamily)
VSKPHVNDADLVARARQGDQAAFGELVRRHQAAVQRAALTASGSAADADDIAQDAFVLAFERLKSFRGESSFKTWVLTIAWNQAMNHRRKAARWFKRFMSVDSAHGSAFTSIEFAASGGTPEDLLARGQLRDEIRDAIRALPDTLRHALLLAASGEYSYDEIGAMVNAKTGTIKWRVSEARRRVRERIDRRSAD